MPRKDCISFCKSEGNDVLLCLSHTILGGVTGIAGESTGIACAFTWVNLSIAFFILGVFHSIYYVFAYLLGLHSAQEMQVC